MLNILIAGKSALDYNRTQVIIEGLKTHPEVEVLLFEFGVKNAETGKKLSELAKSADFIYVPPFRNTDVKFVRKYTDKTIVFDPLVSNYLTKVIDYGHWWKALFKIGTDKKPMKECDILIADTEGHKDYFIKKFGIPESKVHVLYVGADTSKYYPSEKTVGQIFRVGFYGSFVPLQGAPKIIDAAAILKDHQDIHFDIIGSGAEFNAAKAIADKHSLKNISFLGWLKSGKLKDAIDQMDVCLGIFGDSLKADLVIPNKVFHYAAQKKCIITKETPGIREVFTPDENIVAIQNSPECIANKILELKENRSEIERIASAGYDLVSNNYSHIEIGKRLVEILKA